MIVILFRLLGSLGIFLFGMRVMSDGIQKVAGDRMRTILNYMTSNRVIAVFTGFLITGIIQSSSATTVMVISFTNAALLELQQAIGVIMGANIGTTVTTWIVSFFGFKFNISAIALPIVGFGVPFFLSKKHHRRYQGEALIGFGLLFIGLAFLKDSLPNINAETLAFLQNYSERGFLSFVIFVTAGTILTIILESSSAAMAITVTMAYKGWIGFESAAAIVLGENIGTTIKALLVSIGTSTNARRAARAHFFFNVFGVIWMAFAFKFFLILILKLAPWDATLQENFPLNLALFHTIFNLSNTILFLPFLKYYTQFIEKVVKDRLSDQKPGYHLQYISTGVQDTAQLNLLNARREIVRMSNVVEKLFKVFQLVYTNPGQRLSEGVQQGKELEDLTDQMQEEISRFLVECSKEQLSETNVNNLNAMMRIAHELESIADSCYNLIILAQQKYNKHIQIHHNAHESIQAYSKLVFSFIQFYQENIDQSFDNHQMQIAFQLENQVNQYRHDFNKSAQKRLQKGSDVRSELLYLDLIKNFEHIGDNALNIAQALRQMR